MIDTVNGTPPEDAGLPEGRPANPPPPPPVTDRDRMVNRVVVVFLNGRRIRGFVWDVNPERGEFHLYATDDTAETRAELVKLEECKALIFVKSFAGNPDYKENKTEFTGRARWGRPYEVVFRDGERIVGTVETFHPEKLGFYIIPPDPRSNSLRIFVVTANAGSVRPLDQKTGEGKDGVWEAPEPAGYPVEKRTQLVVRLLRDPDVDALAAEVYLPAPVLDHWRKTFLGAGLSALTDEGLAAARAAEGGDRPPDKPDRTPPEKRLDVVLRLFAREDQAVLSQVFLVPFRVLAEWRERFLDAGTRALKEQAVAECEISPETLAAKYREIVAAAGAPASERDAFLDSLSGLLDDLPGS
jgi:hypothetical protein